MLIDSQGRRGGIQHLESFATPLDRHRERLLALWFHGTDDLHDLSEPWHALAYQWGVAAALHKAAYEGEDKGDREYALRAWPIANEGQTYLIREHIVPLLLTFPVPEHVFASDAMPFDQMFFAFEQTVVLNHSEHGSKEANWFALRKTPFGVETFNNMVVYDKRTGQASETSIMSSYLAFGQRIGDDYTHTIGGLVVALLAFVNSPFTEQKREKMPRSFRRHELAESPERDTLITVIHMRAAKSQPNAANGSGRAHDHRYWVRGHLRAQWRPSTKDHKVIWIAPHMRGPADADERFTVRHVVR